MTFLTSNLLLLGVGGTVLLLVGTVRFRVWTVRPNRIVLVIAILLLIGCGGGILKTIQNPPAPEGVVDETDRGDVRVDDPKFALKRLQLEWDSEDAATWPAAETLADISEIAYRPPHEAEKLYQELGFTNVMPVVHGSMIGYVITGDDVTVVAFRGTDFSEISDWIANLGRSAAETPHGPVHSGFHAAYQSMKPQVEAILLERKTEHLWVTGHSLGGALALMCAYDLENSSPQRLRGIMTFGQPMVARQQFAEYVDKTLVGRYARFVNRDDIVPRVPPSHKACGSLVWFTDEGIKRSKSHRVLHGDSDPYETQKYTVEDAEIDPLTEGEFRALKAKLRTGGADQPDANNVPRTMEFRSEEGEDEQLFGDPQVRAEYAMMATIFDDHSMQLYLERIREMNGVGYMGER